MVALVRKLRTATRLLVTNPFKLVVLMLKTGPFWRLVPDEMALRILYRLRVGGELNLRNPRTFNEKILWLMLHNRNPEYTNMVDKYEAKKIILDRLGEDGSQYIIPTIGVYNSFAEIDFDALPDQFVLKATHDSGSVFPCRDKATFDFKKARKALQKSLNRNYFWGTREWPYKNVKRRILCEELLETEDGKAPKDYKIFCMNGIPKFFYIAHDRGVATKFDFLDMQWNRLPVEQEYPTSDYVLTRPSQWNQIIKCAKRISQGIPHVRIDFYVDKLGKPYVGELTFAHLAGLTPFLPARYDCIFGDLIELPDQKIV